MLGSLTEAEDAVQEAWLRLSGAAHAEVDDLPAWLTTVVARISLNALRARKKRSQAQFPELVIEPAVTASAEQGAVLANSLGLALLVVLETLAPAERVAFVLHDVFGMPFEEIAPVLERTPEAARQLASRARRRVQARNADSDADIAVQRSVVDAFLAAASGGDFQGLVAVLDPNVVLRADFGNQVTEHAGAEAVARRAATFTRIGVVRHRALVNGVPGIVCVRDEKPFAIMAFTFRAGRIAQIDIARDPASLHRLDQLLLSR